jgi:phage gp36-like protein
MAFATYADLEKALDVRIIAELCSDNGEDSAPPNPITTMALERATAMIKSYARVGNIYTDLDLTTLASAGDWLLVGLTCDLATEILFQRRGMVVPPAVEERRKRAYEMLEHLRDGRQIFGAISKAADAGLPEVRATPLQTLAYYNQVSSSAFFPSRKPNTMPGG